jgi:hypothetical protein
MNKNNIEFWLFTIAVLFFCFLLWKYDTGFGSCDEYASDYSCKYVIERADYEVYYWRNVKADNPDDEKPIGRVVGLKECKNTAMKHAAIIGEAWNNRAYICILVDDGKFMEKHRLLEPNSSLPLSSNVSNGLAIKDEPYADLIGISDSKLVYESIDYEARRILRLSSSVNTGFIGFIAGLPIIKWVTASASPGELRSHINSLNMYVHQFNWLGIYSNPPLRYDVSEKNLDDEVFEIMKLNTELYIRALQKYENKYNKLPEGYYYPGTKTRIESLPGFKPRSP